MAKKNVKWLRNIDGGPPLTMLLKFQAGTTQAVDEGEFLELSSGNFIPLATDKAMAGTVAISLEEIKSGDLAGYYMGLVPRPGDLFEADLLSTDAQNPDRGAAVYVDGDDSVTTTAGSNVIGTVVDHDGFPMRSGHASDDASIAAGTTIGNVPNGKVVISIKEGASYYNALFADDA